MAERVAARHRGARNLEDLDFESPMTRIPTTDFRLTFSGLSVKRGIHWIGMEVAPGAESRRALCFQRRAA